MDRKKFRIFKFRTGNERDIEALKNNYLWFAHLDNLNDPYEGWAGLENSNVTNEIRIKFLKRIFMEEPKKTCSVEEEVRNLYFEYLQRGKGKFERFVDELAIKQLNEFFFEHRESTNICSLSLAKDNHDFPAPLNNMMLWSHYADGFKGFCIEYDFEELKKSIKKNNVDEIANHIVDYSETGKLPVIHLSTVFNDVINSSKNCSTDILKTFCTKEKTWRYENEVRLLSTIEGKKLFNPECYKAIYLSEKMNPIIRKTILDFVKLLPKPPTVYDVVLHKLEYKFGFLEVPI